MGIGWIGLLGKISNSPIEMGYSEKHILCYSVFKLEKLSPEKKASPQPNNLNRASPQPYNLGYIYPDLVDWIQGKALAVQLGKFKKKIITIVLWSLLGLYYDSVG